MSLSQACQDFRQVRRSTLPLAIRPVLAIFATVALPALLVGASECWAISSDELSPVPDLQLGHGAALSSVAMSADGKWVLTSGEDKTFKVWNAATGELQSTTSIAQKGSFSANGEVLVTADIKQLVSVRTGRVMSTLPGAGGEGFTFDKSGKTMAMRFYDGSPPAVLDLTTGKLLGNLGGRDSRCVELSDDGVLLASATSSNAIELWGVRTGELKLALAQDGRTTLLAFSPDGTRLASARYMAGPQHKEFVSLWEVGTGKLLREWPSRQLSALEFSPDGALLAVGGSTIELWDTASGVLKQTLRGHTAGVMSLCFSRDGLSLISGSRDKTARLWDVATGTEKRVLGRSLGVLDVAFDPAGGRLASAKEDGTIDVWDLQHGRLTLRIEHAGVQSIAFSPDGHKLASGGRAGIRLWDAQTGAIAGFMQGPAGYLFTSIAFLPDGRSVAGAGGPHVQFWNVESRKALRTLDSPGLNPSQRLAISPDGKLLAATYYDGVARLWDLQTGAIRRTFTDKKYTGPLAFSSDSKTLALVSDLVRLWDVETGELRHTLVTTPYSCFGLTLAPDGQSAAFSAGRKIVISDVKTGKLTASVPAHTGLLAALSLSPNGAILASGGEDQVKLWDAATGRLLASLVSLPAMDESSPRVRDRVAVVPPTPGGATTPEYLIVTPEGYYSGSVQAPRFIHLRLNRDSFPAECFQARFYRPDFTLRALAGKEVYEKEPLRGVYPPVVSVVTPANGSKVNGQKATVVMEASDDSEVRSVLLFVNGSRIDAHPVAGEAKPISATAKELTQGDTSPLPTGHTRSRRFTATIPLPGNPSFRLQAIAIDDDGLQSPRAESTFFRDNVGGSAPGLQATGLSRARLIGLCVGVGQYKNPKLNLRFADCDATELARRLNEQKSLYSAAEVTSLTNVQATRSGIMAALDSLIAKTHPDDTVVISFSGHGWRSDTRTFYFASHEVDTAKVATTALPWTAVVQKLTALSERSRRVVVLLDACHSGSAASNEELVKSVLSANSGVMVFSSSRGSEVSLEDPLWQHGAFTKGLLTAMGTAAKPGPPVSLWDFISAVRRQVSALTKDQQHPQVPFLQDFDTDTPVTTGAANGLDAALLQAESLHGTP